MDSKGGEGREVDLCGSGSGREAGRKVVKGEDRLEVVWIELEPASPHFSPHFGLLAI